MPEGTETTTETAPATGTETETTSTTTEPTAEELAAEVEKWKANSRKHEDRSKANATAAKELEALKLASMDEVGKAVETARSEARAAALVEVGGKLVAAEVKLAAAGRITDVDALLEGLNVSKFLTDEGDPDSAAIAAWVDKIAPAPAEGEAPAGFPPVPDIGQGNRQTVPLGSDPLMQMLQSVIGPK